ncbi:MAG: 16S rRNA (guanine(966)-N(2))-methyltransferase RsmD [Candidatus Subteraquimicrobiales bacterium]|nr:16S rRNA (guanine(966)-N(2))-methyltransferase RsmD [Candidatus Subteraquimicrobiales bacterium]
MRIIAGFARGRKLLAPKIRGLRPTADRVKESLFNMLGGITKNTNVLDLYAGTGSLGIEALSRGANSAIFVECNRTVLDYLKKNLELTGFSSKSKTLEGKAEKVLKQLIKEGCLFNLIFIDPPYKIDFSNLIEALKDSVLISSPQGLIVLEHSKKIDAASIESFLIDDITCVKTRKFGDTHVSIFKKYK